MIDEQLKTYRRLSKALAEIKEDTPSLIGFTVSAAHHDGTVNNCERTIIDITFEWRT